MSTTTDPRYPIGPFEAPAEITPERIAGWIDEIEALPADLRATVEPLSEAQLDTPYREGGWTVRQVVHHVADSHMNSVTRFKWALTEDRPTIKDYREQLWAELADAGLPVGPSLDLLTALHTRWVTLLRSMDGDDWKREFVHPESGPVALGVNVAIYAWHGKHHRAHAELVARGA